MTQQDYKHKKPKENQPGVFTTFEQLEHFCRF
jgi:hypothetical protein